MLQMLTTLMTPPMTPIMLLIDTSSIKALIEWHVQNADQLEDTLKQIQQSMHKFDAIFHHITQLQLMTDNHWLFPLLPATQPSPMTMPPALPNHPTSCPSPWLPLPAPFGSLRSLWHPGPRPTQHTHLRQQTPPCKLNTCSKQQAGSTASPGLPPHPFYHKNALVNVHYWPHPSSRFMTALLCLAKNHYHPP